MPNSIHCMNMNYRTCPLEQCRRSPLSTMYMPTTHRYVGHTDSEHTQLRPEGDMRRTHGYPKLHSQWFEYNSRILYGGDSDLVRVFAFAWMYKYFHLFVQDAQSTLTRLILTDSERTCIDPKSRLCSICHTNHGTGADRFRCQSKCGFSYSSQPAACASEISGCIPAASRSLPLAGWRRNHGQVVRSVSLISPPHPTHTSVWTEVVTGAG